MFRRLSRQPIFLLLIALAGNLLIAAPSIAEEATGYLKGKIVDGAGNPVTGVKVALIEDGREFSAGVTDTTGCYSLMAILGRRSLQFKLGLNLFGLTTKTQRKLDIRRSSALIMVGDPAKPAFKGDVPVYFADAGRYGEYLCDIVAPADGGTAHWSDPGYFELGEVMAAPLIVKEGQSVVFTVAVKVPPHPELTASLRVLLRSSLFSKGALKAFDDGEGADKAKGDGIYTAEYEIPKKGPFGFFLVSADEILPELSARFKPGEAWPILFSTSESSEAGGHVERVTQVYSVGGVETGLAAEWYYYADTDEDLYWFEQAQNEASKTQTKYRWYELFAREKLASKNTGLFVCRGNVEFGAATYFERAIESFEAGDLDTAENKLADAKKRAPDYESIPIWEARLKIARGDRAGAIKVLEDARLAKRDPMMNVVLAELYRETGDMQNAVDAYVRAYNATYDPQILRTLALYLYDAGEWAASQKVFDNLKYYAAGIPYRYDFLMHGTFEFDQRFKSESVVAEKLLYSEFVPPADSWEENLFEEALILGSLSGWKARMGRKNADDLSEAQARKYAVMLRLAREYDEAKEAAAGISGADGNLERGLIAMDVALSDYAGGQAASSGAAEKEPPVAPAKLAEAIADFKASADADEKSAAAQYNLALAYYLSGDLSLARDAVEEALALAPENQEVRFLAANVYEGLGNVTKAVEHWQWFVDEAPEGAVKIMTGEHLTDLKKSLGKAE